jgi:hypothetical protein
MLIALTFILKLIISIHSKTVTHDMFSHENVHEESSNLVSIKVSNLECGAHWFWLDIDSILLLCRPCAVQEIAEHKASYLHFQDALCVVQDTCILDQVQLIRLPSTLVVQVRF